MAFLVDVLSCGSSGEDSLTRFARIGLDDGGGVMGANYCPDCGERLIEGKPFCANPAKRISGRRTCES